MRICTPAAANLSVNAALVNCAARSVLKIFGRPFHKASLSAPRQNEVSIVSDRQLVRLINRQPAQQVGLDPVLRCRLARLRLWARRFEPYHPHQPLQAVAVDLTASLAQLHRRPYER